MRKIVSLILILGLIYSCGTTKSTQGNSAQNPSDFSTIIVDKETDKPQKRIEEHPVYHASPTILTNIKHTKLEISLNWEKSELNGIATLTCSPYFYSTDSLILDAQSMEIKSVKIGEKNLNYQYNDSKLLRIGLDKEYTRHETYLIEIAYIAKPEEKEKGGSDAIRSNKGLYFINPRGENPNQMTQVWTQGEPEDNSSWFPTIDRPNQKTTQEVYFTVDDKYVTLSNGKLVSSQKNKDGTRTDYWKQDLPHAPYLFMIAAGEFEIVKDSYTKKDGTTIPVYYYVEPEWKEYAKEIFGETPRMIRFFSELLGVEYQWDKYHQIVVREYVSGAMENTGAVVFGDFTYKTSRELLDEDEQAIIAHELFHHWFGDLVTLESWSNLPLNESFANYSQYLWDEYSRGRDEADYNAANEAEGYYNAMGTGHHNMIWYDYNLIGDMFDAHSYNKGGRILHMLRYYLGDEAFFLGLNDYLTVNAFKTVELANLRMSFEKISGEDLNWFFNQWFFNMGHPRLKVDYTEENQKVTLIVEQQQNLSIYPLYKLPVKVGIYANDKHTTYYITIDKSLQSFTFPFEGELQNIVFDEDRALLAKIKFDKPKEWYIHQYYHAPRFVDREEALKQGARVTSEGSSEMILAATKDPFWGIRELAISSFSKLPKNKSNEAFERLIQLATQDSSSHVRKTAIESLSANLNVSERREITLSILQKTIQEDPSIAVVSAALDGLVQGKKEDQRLVLELCKDLEKDPNPALLAKVVDIYSNLGNESHLSFMADVIMEGKLSGYKMLDVLFSFNQLYLEMDIPTKVEYYYVFESFKNTTDVYVNYVLPMIINRIHYQLELDISKLEKEISTLENQGKTGEATLVQRKLNQAEELKKRNLKMAK